MLNKNLEGASQAVQHLLGRRRGGGIFDRAHNLRRQIGRHRLAYRPRQHELVGAKDDAALQLVELLLKGDHADEDDALLEAEGVLVLVVCAGLVAGVFAVLGGAEDDEGVARLDRRENCLVDVGTTPPL